MYMSSLTLPHSSFNQIKIQYNSDGDDHFKMIGCQQLYKMNGFDHHPETQKWV